MIVKIGNYIINTDYISHIYKEDVDLDGVTESVICINISQDILCYNSLFDGDNFAKALKVYIWFLERAIDDVQSPSQ